MRIESGPAATDRNWRLLQTVVFLGFAGYFVYDGAVGYAARNRAEAEQQLLAPPFEGRIRWEQLGDTPDVEDFERFRSAAAPTVEALHRHLGEPKLTAVSGGLTREIFVSRYGRVEVDVTGSQAMPVPPGWKKWFKSRAEITQQFYWAIAPALAGVYFLWRLVQAATLRVVVDGDGLTYAGRRIPLSAMTSLRDYSRKGWVDLYYRDGERERKLRLDNQKVKRFEEIIAALCEARGFENPLPAPADEDAPAPAGAGDATRD